MMIPDTEVSQQQIRFLFLDYLRSLSMLLVVWDHMICQFSERHGEKLFVVSFLNKYVNVPLGIIQYFGWLAVCLFFLISGFIITHVSQKEDILEFLMKRYFRIFPILSLFVFISLIFETEFKSTLTYWNLFLNLTLLNVTVVPQYSYVGVTWTLFIEVVFYLIVAATMLFKNPFLKITLCLTFCNLIVYTCSSFGDNYFLFAASVAYIPFLITGQIIYFFLYAKGLSIFSFLFSIIYCYFSILFGIYSIHYTFLPTANSYLISYMYACFIFCLCYICESKFKDLPWIVGLISASSYTTYLAHASVGINLEEILYPYLGIYKSIGIAMVFTSSTIVLVHYFIEKPLLRFSNRLVRLVGHRRLNSARRARALSR